MRIGIQSAMAVVMLACLAAMVISPFADLPLTVNTKEHQADQAFSALPLCIALSAAAGLVIALAPGRQAMEHASVADVISITCAYLC